eukprot:Lankesteria_metandrocarpae@DN5353_c1_g1_i7.p1
MTAIRSGSVWLAVVVVLLLHQHQPATATGGDGKRVFGAHGRSSKRRQSGGKHETTIRTTERTIRTEAEAESVGAPVSVDAQHVRSKYSDPKPLSVVRCKSGQADFGERQPDTDQVKWYPGELEKVFGNGNGVRLRKQDNLYSDDSDFVHSPEHVVSETRSDNGSVVKTIKFDTKDAIRFSVRDNYSYDIHGPNGKYYTMTIGRYGTSTKKNCLLTTTQDGTVCSIG